MVMDRRVIGEAVTSYINGNISTFKEFLRSCSNVDLLNTVYIFHQMTGEGYDIILSKFADYLR